MGIKRVVDIDFWTDEKVESFTPEEKYFWLYLITNPYTKQLGIYHITIKQMSFHLGYDTETVIKLLNRFEKEYKLIKFVDSEIAIKNSLKYSILKGGKPVEDCIKADIKNIKNKSLIKWVFNSLDLEDVSTTVQKVITEYKDINNDNDNDNDSIVDDTPTNRGRFVPPTVEEVAEYCRERNNSVNPQRFVDFYESKGWMVGRNKMKDWKAAIRSTWEIGHKEEDKLPVYDPSKNKKIDDDELDRLLSLRGK